MSSGAFIISSGSSHTIMATGSGLFALGTGEYGKLGLGNRQDHFIPRKVTFFDGKRITEIAAGVSHSMVVADGSLYVFGRGGSGELGLGDQQDHLIPQKVPFFEGKNITAIVAGGLYSMVVADASLYAFGKENFGHLGLGNRQDYYTPQKAPFFEGKNITAIAVSCNHTMVVADRILYVFGLGWYGQLGLGYRQDHGTPQKVPFFEGKNITVIAAGGLHSMVVADGSLYAFGRGDSGELGLGDQQDHLIPQKVTFFDGKRIRAVAVSCNHTMVVADGVLYAFGKGEFGRLGLGDHKDRLVPQEVAFFRGQSIATVVAGFFHTMVVLRNGQVWKCGSMDGILENCSTSFTLLEVPRLRPSISPYWYPADAVIASPRFEEDNSKRAALATAITLMWTHHSWVRSGVDEVLCDILSFMES